MLSVNTVPARAAARAPSISPPKPAIRAIPVGAIMTGVSISVPSTRVRWLRSLTSTSCLGRSVRRSNALVLRRSVTSEPAPPSMKSNATLGRRRRAASRTSSSVAMAAINYLPTVWIS